MRHIKKFESFDHINEEEGWKENILVGLLSLLGVSAIGQTKDKDNKRIYHTKSEQSMTNMVKRGWSLDSTQVNTLWQEVQSSKPDTITMVTKLSLDKDQYFTSGSFELSQDVRDSISNTLSEISNSGGIITDIKIVSSTDKQGLSINLQKQLKSKNYSPDNKGLSKARNESVSDYLTSLGINDTLIQSNQKYEQGEQTIDQSSRYVTIDIAYLVISKDVAPSKSVDTPISNNTYWLSTVNKKSSNGTYKFKGGFKKTHKNGPIKNHKRGHRSCVDKCYFK